MNRGLKRLKAAWKDKNQDLHSSLVKLPDDNQELIKPSLADWKKEISAEGATNQSDHCFEKGERAFSEHKYREAIEHYRKATEERKSASSCLALGVSHMMLSQIRQGNEAFKAGTQISLTGQNIEMQIAGLLNLGQSLGNLGKYGAATAHLEQAKNLSISNNLKEWELLALFQLSTAAFVRGFYPESQEYSRQLVQQARALGDHASHAKALYIDGLICTSQSRYDDAESVLSAGLEISQAAGRSYESARILSQLAAVYGFKGKGHDSLEHAKKAQATYRRLGSPQGEAKAIGLIASIRHINEGEDTGRELFERAGQINEQAGYRRGRIREKLALAGLLIQQRTQGAVAGILGEAVVAAESVGHRVLYLESASLLTAVREDLGESDKITVLEKLLEGDEEPAKATGVKIRQYLASICLASGDPGAAAAYCQQALADSQELGLRREQGIVLGLQAQIYEYQGQAGLAVEYNGHAPVLGER